MVNAKSVFYDGLYTLSGRVVRTLLALLLSILLARALGPHERGVYAIPTAVYTGMLLTMFGGIIPAMGYFMLNRNAGRGIVLPAMLTGVVFVAASSVPIVAMAVLSHNAWAIAPALWLLVGSIPAYVLMGYAVGTKRIRWQSTYLALSTGSLLLFVAVALILLPHTARVAVMGYVAGTIAIGAVSFGVIAKDVRSLPYAPVSFVAFLLFAVRAGLGNLITQINYRGDLYVVALLTAPALLGQYTVAVSAADALYVVTQIPAIVTSPHVGSLDRDGAARITARCVRATLVTSLAIALFCFLVVPYAVRFLYGAAYMPAVAPLRVLLISTVVVSLGTPIANFFTLKLGKPEITLISTSCAACVCIAASFLMIPHFGLIGAAAATTAAYILGQGIWIWLFMRSTRIPLADLFVPTGGDVRTLAQLSRALIQERLLGHRAA